MLYICNFVYLPPSCLVGLAADSDEFELELVDELIPFLGGDVTMPRSDVGDVILLLIDGGDVKLLFVDELGDDTPFSVDFVGLSCPVRNGLLVTSLDI